MPLIHTGYQTRQLRLQTELESPFADVLGATAEQAFSESPVLATVRSIELARAGQATARLTAEDARARIKENGVEGHLTVPDEGIAAPALDILIDRKRSELKRADVFARAPKGFLPATARLGMALATSVLDPVNVGLAFIPVVGEARYASYLKSASGVLGRTAVRAGVGAAEGTAGAAIIEPLIYGVKQQEQADYGMQDSLLNVGFGTIFGGGLHVVAGGVRESAQALRRLRPETGSLGAHIAELPLDVQENALRTAVSQTVQGRDVDIEAIMPPKSNIPRAEHLSSEYRAIERNFADVIERDVDSALRAYDAVEGSDGGRILNTDLARELSPAYRADRTRSAAVHEPASWIVKENYASKLKEAPKAGQNADVIFTGGGTGAGKTTAINQLAQAAEFRNAQIVFDTNLNSLKSAVTKIDQALAAGKKALIYYVWRDPVESLTKGALPRAMRMGRTVPINEHAATHTGGAETIKQLASKYAGDERVEITVFDNSHGKGNARIGQIEDIPVLDYNAVRGNLSQALDREFAEGRISEAVYRGTRGQERTAQARGQDRRRAGSQPEQERASRQVDLANRSAERQASPESDPTADPRASEFADEQLAEAPPAADELAADKAALADALTALKEVARTHDSENVLDELKPFDEAIANADTYGKAARAAVLCGQSH